VISKGLQPQQSQDSETMADDYPTRPRMDKIPGGSLYHFAFLFRIFLSEMLGLALILFAVTLVPTDSYVPIPIMVGLVFAYVIGIFGPISGAQVNPAVSLALLLTRRLSIVHTIVCIAGQLLGAIAGTWFATVLGPVGLADTPMLAMTNPHPDLSNAKVLGLEIVATAILVTAVLSVCDEFRDKPWTMCHVCIFPLFFGVTLALLATFIGPYTGASMNPARSLGPAILAGEFKDQWLYVVAPLIGAAVATVIYEGFLSDGASLERLKAWFSDPEFSRSTNYKAIKERSMPY